MLKAVFKTFPDQETLMSAQPVPAPTEFDLDATTIASLQARLEQLERELQAGIAKQRAQLATHDSATSNNFVAGSEGALSIESDDEALAMLSHEECEWTAVHEALSRIKDGRYGTCARCEEPIGRDRLVAVPYASLCLTCQTVDEAQSASHLHSHKH
jgi:DnaK suppressor protein